MPPVAGAALVAVAFSAGSTAIVSGVGAITVASLVSAAALAGGSAALQLATAPKSPGAQPNVSIRQRTPVYLPDVYGECRVGGVAALYRQSVDASNNDLITVWALAAHRIDQVVEIRDGKKLIWSQVAGVAPDFVDRVEIAVRLGFGTQSPPADLLAGLSGVIDSNFKLNGIPYVYIRFKKVTGRKSKWPDGMPANLWFRVRGARVFDPRTETTAWSDNWALCFRDWLIRRGGMSTARFDDDQIAAAANICDESVAVAGGTQARYVVNGAFASEVACSDMLGEWMRQGGNLRGLVNAGDTLHIMPGAYSAPVATFGVDDYVVQPLTLDPESFAEDLWEAVRTTYRPQGKHFNAAQTNQVVFDDYAGDPDDARTLELDYTRETDYRRAARLGLLALRQSRRTVRISFAVPLTEANASLLPGERVQAELDPFGLSGVFEVLERRALMDPESPRVEILALVDHSSFWGWTSGTATDTPAGLDSTLKDPFEVAPVTGVTASGARRVEGDGSVTRWIDVAWTPPAAEPYLDHYRVEWVQGGETFDAETTATGFRINNLGTGAVTILVYVVNTLGRESDGVGPGGTVTPTGDATPPGPPSSGSIAARRGAFLFRMGKPSDADLAGMRLYEGGAGAAFGATTAILDIACLPGAQPVEFVREGLGSGVTRTYYVTCFDRSGNEGAAFGPLTSTTSQSFDDALADIGADLLAYGVQSGSSLPASGDRVDQLFFLTTAVKLYRWTGSAWTDVFNTYIGSNYITTGMLGANVVTAEKAAFASLAALGISVVTADITNANITNAKIANLAVDTGKLAVDSASQWNVATGSALNSNLFSFNLPRAGVMVGWAARRITLTSGSGDSGIIRGRLTLQINGVTRHTDYIELDGNLGELNEVTGMVGLIGVADFGSSGSRQYRIETSQEGAGSGSMSVGDYRVAGVASYA